ncbi:MAG: FG-GAP repeat protein, partial [Bacteroidota bacterium]
MKTFLLLLFCSGWHLALWGQFAPVGSQLDGNAPNDNFGWDVACNQSGQIIAVGAPLYDDDFGQVRVYQESAGTWIQLGGDIEGSSIGNQFGFSLALNAAGDRLAIGGIGGQPGNGGQVVVFALEAGNWTPLGDTILAESAGDQFGFSLDMNASGDRLVVGAVNNDGNGGESGSVRVFELQNNVWTQLGDDLDGDNPNDKLGESVGMNAAGDIIAAGSVNRNGAGFNSGQIKVWQWDGTSWNQLGSDIFGGGNGEF